MLALCLALLLPHAALCLRNDDDLKSWRITGESVFVATPSSSPLSLASQVAAGFGPRPNSSVTYNTDQELGDGNSGKVYLATVQGGADNGAKVAMKVIPESYLKDPRHFREASTEVEVQRDSRLRHKNIVAMHDVYSEGPNLHIVMELVPGTSLGGKTRRELFYEQQYNWRQTQAGLSEERTKEVFGQLLDAVLFCHSRGVAHCDLKPENVLLADRSTVKLADFGSSFDMHKHGNHFSAGYFGTPEYMPPEMLRVENSTQYDVREKDMWALGSMLFEMKRGLLPYQDTKASKDEMIDNIKDDVRMFHLPAGTDAKMSTFIEGLLSRKPDQRSRGQALKAAMQTGGWLEDWRPSFDGWQQTLP